MSMTVGVDSESARCSKVQYDLLVVLALDIHEADSSVDLTSEITIARQSQRSQ